MICFLQLLEEQEKKKRMGPILCMEYRWKYLVNPYASPGVYVFCVLIWFFFFFGSSCCCFVFVLFAFADMAEEMSELYHLVGFTGVSLRVEWFANVRQCHILSLIFNTSASGRSKGHFYSLILSFWAEMYILKDGYKIIIKLSCQVINTRHLTESYVL